MLVVLGLIDCNPRVKKHIYRYDLILYFFGMMWWILGYLSFMSTKTIAYLCVFLPWVFAICECWFKNEISSYQEHKGNYYYSNFLFFVSNARLMSLIDHPNSLTPIRWEFLWKTMATCAEDYYHLKIIAQAKQASRQP